jgi:hypothetical protein
MNKSYFYRKARAYVVGQSAQNPLFYSDHDPVWVLSLSLLVTRKDRQCVYPCHLLVDFQKLAKN